MGTPLQSPPCCSNIIQVEFFKLPYSCTHHLLGPLISQLVTEKANAVFVVSTIKENANACTCHLIYLSTTCPCTCYHTMCDFKLCW